MNWECIVTVIQAAVILSTSLIFYLQEIVIQKQCLLLGFRKLTLNLNTQIFIQNTFSPGTDLSNLTSVHVQYQDMSCIKYSRTPSVYWDSFLAAFGGILGLCLGGSLLSLAEVVYYATFKFICLFISNENNNKVRAVVGKKNVVQNSQYFW